MRQANQRVTRGCRVANDAVRHVHKSRHHPTQGWVPSLIAYRAYICYLRKIMHNRARTAITARVSAFLTYSFFQVLMRTICLPGVLLHGPPGTGKTLLARACANHTKAIFIKLAGPQLVQMYIGDGAKVLPFCFLITDSTFLSVHRFVAKACQRRFQNGEGKNQGKGRCRCHHFHR